MIDPDTTIVIRFVPTDQPTLQEIIDDEPTDTDPAAVTTPLQTPEPKNFRPIGVEW